MSRPTNRRSGGSRPGRGAPSGAPLALLALFAAVSAAACKEKAPPPDLSRPAIADAGTTTLQPTVLPLAASASAGARTAPRPAPGPTAEAVLDQARAHVGEAVHLSTEKDACPAVLPLLDVSYSLARASTPLDEPTLAIFARCAAHAQRWRLLRELAEAIAAGERKLETTYLLPRAHIGVGDYDVAESLAKATLRAWPTEGEAYNTAALAALRVRDWDAAVKAADQALLVQRKHDANDRVTALAHGLRGAGLLRMGKTEAGVHEIESAKGHEGVLDVTEVTLEAALAVRKSGLLVTVDAPREASPALWPLYAKKVAPLTGLVTVALQNLTDRPLSVMVEVALGGAETAAESESVVKGRPVTLALTPEWKRGAPPGGAKGGEPRELTVTVTGAGDHGVLYRQTSKLTLEPKGAMPTVLRAHAEDLRSAFALEAAWVTPAAPAVTALVEAAKGRLKGGSKRFEGAAGASAPQAKALWDELRSRGVAFHRDPTVDSEARESRACRLPGEILESGEGDSLESSVLFASLLEAIGLDVVLVRTPGHRMVGWLGTPADLAATDGVVSTVKSPLGQAFFLETTTVGEGPFDAAVLRGDAQWVAATNDGSVTSGRAEIERVSDLRRRGLAPLAQ